MNKNLRKKTSTNEIKKSKEKKSNITKWRHEKMQENKTQNKVKEKKK